MVQEYVSVLPFPYPPLPVRVWKDTLPKIKCPFCGTTFNVEKGAVKCPKCEVSYIVSDWNWESFLWGVGVGLILGLIISLGVYYFVFRPIVPIVRVAATFREILKV